MSKLRHRQEGGDADGCLPVLLRVQELWNSAQAQAGRLLRVLFLRRRSLSANSGGPRKRGGKRLLRNVTNGADTTVRPRRDWAGSIPTYGWTWALPIAAIVAGLFIDVHVRTAIWTVALLWMGTACILNARRCGRTHCRFTGPYCIAMIVPVLVLGSGVVAAGFLAWAVLAVLILMTGKIIWWTTERAWGRYS